MLVRKFLFIYFIFFAISDVPAQLCIGSLGDPIINITFGSGANPGPMLSSTKNLNYISTDCPGDGFYAVRNSTSRCFGSTWHSLNSDHTGDANGYFMLINASYEKSDFYIDTIKGLCPNTTYEFAAWVMNVQVPRTSCGTVILPNLTFNIETADGRVLQRSSTGDIATTPSPMWNQYGSFFTTPAGVSNVVLRLINNSNGGCGNDIAIDDITFRPCGPKLTPSIRGVPGLVKEFCSGDDAEVILDCDVSAGYSNPAYRWQQSKDSGRTWTDIAGETSTTLKRKFTPPSPAASYLYRLSVGEASNTGIANCRVASAILTVNVNSRPFAAIIANSPVCQRSTLKLSATPAIENATYTWAGVNGFTGNGASVVIDSVQMSNAGRYYVDAVSTKGCRSTDSITVVVNPAPVAHTASGSRTICQGDTVLLNSSGGTSYHWFPSAGLSSALVANPVATPSASTVYKVVVANQAGCADTATITISVIPKPMVNAGPDKSLLEGQSVQLDGSLSGKNTSIVWFPVSFVSDIHSLRPTVSPVSSTRYTLTAVSLEGCGTASDTVNVYVYKKIAVPNAFSPNADGVNDTWNISHLSGYNNIDLSVFNRYGQPVYNAKNYSRPWDGTFNGKPLPVGTYYYVLDLKLGLPKLTGFVVILR